MRQLQNADGWTIVQIMVALLIAGAVAAVAVEIIIDKRCEADPARSICADRSSASEATIG